MENSSDVLIIPLLLLKLVYIIRMIFIILLIVGFVIEISEHLKKEKFSSLKVIKILLKYSFTGLIVWISPYVFFKWMKYIIYFLRQ